ncbi:MAG: deoxyribonuclease IV [Planctomycetota bacterium]
MFGSHLSIAGGMHNALDEAESLGLDTVQVFTKNQQQWKVKPLLDDAVAEWTARLERLGWQGRTVSHASYLINMASPDDELWAKSIGLMREEIERCETLSIPFLVHHPGAYTTSDADSGLTRIADAYKRLLKETKGYRTVLCLEDTVGSGSNLGRSFDELADLRGRILDRSPVPDRVGFCFDTCHAHAGGYDMSGRASAEGVLEEFDRLCGLKHLRVMHLNDSKGDLGSRKDRHAHIGEGTITQPPGRKSQPLKASGFAAVVNHPALRDVPKILETPKGEDDRGRAFDLRNLRRLKGMME